MPASLVVPVAAVFYIAGALSVAAILIMLISMFLGVVTNEDLDSANVIN